LSTSNKDYDVDDDYYYLMKFTLLLVYRIHKPCQ